MGRLILAPASVPGVSMVGYAPHTAKLAKWYADICIPYTVYMENLATPPTADWRKDQTGMKFSIFNFQFSIVSAVAVVVLCAAQPGLGLVVSEIMYHPVDQDEALEFIELYNNQAISEDLSGYAFTNGIEYEFKPATVIGAKQYLVVARDPNALQAAYPDLVGSVQGPFTGRLGNDGERIELSNANGADRYLGSVRGRKALAVIA